MEVTRTAADARQARILATVHAADAGSVTNGWVSRDVRPSPVAAAAPSDAPFPEQPTRDER